jgi:hypothetical protein
MATRSGTLIISATYDDSHRDWYDRLPEPKVRVSTAEGGHPSKALIDTFRWGKKHDAYLLLQDTLEPLVEDVVAPFVDAAEKAKTGAAAWAGFPMFFDTPDQKHWVVEQYQQVEEPKLGVFGPIFWVTRKNLERLEKLYRLPKHPADKLQAQGTERAWAYALGMIGQTPAFLHPWSNEHLASGEALPFRKVFAGRQ